MPREQNRATVNTIITNKKETIDRTITTIFKAPKSYTGEDMSEISLHGSHAIINKVINELSQFSGCRMAEPGEFTRRAFENNKFDLTQIEAIADLVNSETEQQRKQALNQAKNQKSHWQNQQLRLKRQQLRLPQNQQLRLKHSHKQTILCAKKKGNQ